MALGHSSKQTTPVRGQERDGETTGAEQAPVMSPDKRAGPRPPGKFSIGNRAQGKLKRDKRSSLKKVEVCLCFQLGFLGGLQGAL